MPQTPIPTCAVHGDATRIRCVDCDTPICPRCLVRTEVGYKCESCAEPATTPDTRHGGALGGVGAGGRTRGRRWPMAAVVLGALLVVAVSFVVGRSEDPSPPTTLDAVGRWEDVPDLTTIRGTTAAVVLDDGRVLAAGGGVGSIAVAATEIYEPAQDTWARGPDLAQARRGASAVRLGDGRVLIAGGIADNRLLDSAEVYDPERDAWTETGAMTTPRLTFTLTPLPDGRVLAVGGSTPEGERGSGGGQSIRPSATAEVYDPDTGEWQAVVGTMATGRFEHTATSLPDGRVLVAGGLGGDAEDGAFAPLASVELFDPAVGRFTTGPAMRQGRTNHVATATGAGDVLVAGGLGGPGRQSLSSLVSVERYDPVAGGWEPLADLRQGRGGATMTALTDGRVLVAGGEAVSGGSRRSLASAELLDADWQAWAPTPPMPCARSEHAAVGVGEGRVLVMAGDGAFPGEPPAPQGCVELYTAPDA